MLLRLVICWKQPRYPLFQENLFRSTRHESCIIEPTGVKKRKDEIPNAFVDWSNKFSHKYRSSKGKKLRQFSSKLIVTKEDLNKFRLVNDVAHVFQIPF